MHRAVKPLKFMLITLLAGALMGVASAAFLKSLEIVTAFRERTSMMVLLLPAVGVLTAFVYQKYGEGAQRGNNLIIESVHRDVHVPLRMMVLSFLFTVLTHVAGGSAGREGTAVQIGGALTNRLGKWFKLSDPELRVLIMAGISAGFGSVFGTPLAGAFFGLEMCFIGKLSYEALLPCFAAAFAADAVTTALGITHSAHAIENVPALSLPILAVTLGAAVTFALIGKYFSIVIHQVKEFYTRVIKGYLVRSLVASLVVLAAFFLFNGFRYGGLSTWMIDAGFAGKSTIVDPVMKFVLTVLTLGAGFQGGEATPLFDIGASAGGLIAVLTGMEPSLFAALGLITVFGCAANTPITTIILGIELFGTKAVPYYVITALISYYLTGHHGIYGAQLITIPKRKHLEGHRGQSIEAVRKEHAKVGKTDV